MAAQSVVSILLSKESVVLVEKNYVLLLAKLDQYNKWTNKY